MVALTEKRTRADIERLAEALADGARGGAGMKLIYERSQAGRRAGTRARPATCPAPRAGGAAPVAAAAAARAAEPELVRHFTALSTRNFGIDTGFYPLGSCTMKYNPRVNERWSALPGLPRPAPLPGRGRTARARWS